MKKLNPVPFILIITLCLTMMSACIITATPDSSQKENSIPGTYTGIMDYSDMLHDQFVDMGIDLGDSSVTAEFILVLNEDNTYTLDCDPQSIYSSIIGAIRENSDSFLAGMITNFGISADEFEELVKKQGYADLNAFKEELLAEMEASFDEDTAGEMAEQLHEEGTWTADSTTITLTDNSGSATMSGPAGADGTITLSGRVNDADFTVVFRKS